LPIGGSKCTVVRCFNDVVDMKKDINGGVPDTQALAAHYRALIEGFGEDPDRPGLRDTPERAAKARAVRFAQRLSAAAVACQDDADSRHAGGHGYPLGIAMT
jgi:hypothetical protein